uniref:Secreted protein n=1 Tax=Ascaris lumbricoides TaxID=6252 RepID=A0A0M3IUL8_ASCLU
MRTRRANILRDKVSASVPLCGSRSVLLQPILVLELVVVCMSWMCIIVSDLRRSLFLRNSIGMVMSLQHLCRCIRTFWKRKNIYGGASLRPIFAFQYLTQWSSTEDLGGCIF